MAAAPVTETGARRTPRQRRRTSRVSVAHTGSQSLLDVIDTVIDKGLAVDAEIVLGLADIDLVYLRVGALLAAADRVFTESPRHRRRASPSSAASRDTTSTRSMPAMPGRGGDATSVVPRDLDPRSPPPGALAADNTSRSVIRLVLTLVEFVRQLLERQAVRRVRERTLNAAEIERLGTALMQLEATVHELADRHDIDPGELNLDLGPLGTLR